MHIRSAQIGDAERIAAIFNQEVEHGLSNYESRPHSTAERQIWIETLQSGNYPLCVADIDEKVVGFAALSPFHPSSGYRFTVTGSLYVDANVRGGGVGRALATELFASARERGYHSVLAGVNAKNPACIALLKSFGFEQVGLFHEIGWKQGEWQNDVCMQLILPGSEKLSTL